MKITRRVITIGLLSMTLSTASPAQTSSLGLRNRTPEGDQPMVVAAREAPDRPRNVVYDQFAWTAEKPVKPKTFQPGDLLTVIIREQRRWEADSELQTRRKLDLKSELDAFPKPIDGGVGASTFSRGKPNVDYSLDHRLRSDGDSSREDRLTMRMAARILDVKPNGLLVLEGRAKVTFDDEVTEIALTGTCRKEDVTADNTILSTQIADKTLHVNNQGALRSVSSRGWVGRLLDIIRPF